MATCTNNAIKSRINSWFILDFADIQRLVPSITVINSVCVIIFNNTVSNAYASLPKSTFNYAQGFLSHVTANFSHQTSRFA